MAADAPRPRGRPLAPPRSSNPNKARSETTGRTASRSSNTPISTASVLGIAAMDLGTAITSATASTARVSCPARTKPGRPGPRPPPPSDLAATSRSAPEMSRGTPRKRSSSAASRSNQRARRRRRAEDDRADLGVVVRRSLQRLDGIDGQAHRGIAAQHHHARGVALGFVAQQRPQRHHGQHQAAQMGDAPTGPAVRSASG